MELGGVGHSKELSPKKKFLKQFYKDAFWSLYISLP